MQTVNRLISERQFVAMVARLTTSSEGDRRSDDNDEQMTLDQLITQAREIVR